MPGSSVPRVIARRMRRLSVAMSLEVIPPLAIRNEGVRARTVAATAYPPQFGRGQRLASTLPCTGAYERRSDAVDQAKAPGLGASHGQCEYSQVVVAHRVHDGRTFAGQRLQQPGNVRWAAAAQLVQRIVSTSSAGVRPPVFSATQSRRS
jgi:hypothetical protein